MDFKAALRGGQTLLSTINKKIQDAFDGFPHCQRYASICSKSDDQALGIRCLFYTDRRGCSRTRFRSGKESKVVCQSLLDS